MPVARHTRVARLVAPLCPLLGQAAPARSLLRRAAMSADVECEDRLLGLAATGGDAVAAAVVCMRGSDTAEPDEETGVRALRVLADGGDAAAMFYLAAHLLDGNAGDGRWPARRLLSLSVARGFPAAMALLGDLVDSGSAEEEEEEEEDEAFAAHSESESDSDEWSCESAQSERTKAALALLGAAERAGDNNARLQLALLHRYGDGDGDEAERLARAADLLLLCDHPYAPTSFASLPASVRTAATKRQTAAACAEREE